MHRTILISSAGRRNQLIDCFRGDAARLGIELRVIATDAEPDLSPACQVADVAYKVPRCTSDEFIPALQGICRDESVQVVVPTIDPELPGLSEHRDDFESAGTKVMVSSPEVVALAGDKMETARKLATVQVPTPRTVALDVYQRDPSVLRWPVIAKPNAGSASQGIVRPDRPVDLERCDAAAGLIVQELWPGHEFTVNMFFDGGGQLRCAVPHRRIETRAGEVAKGRTEDVTVLRESAKKIARCLSGARGALCFQAIVTDSGECAVFEINARFGGGYPLAHRAGARFTQWILEESLGIPSTSSDEWKSGVTMLRYDAAVFRDA